MPDLEDDDGPFEAGVEFIEPEDFLPASPFPIDAQRLGINQWTADSHAGLLAVAASLNSEKPWHRVAAWVLLVIVVVPLVLTLWYQLT